METMFLSFLSCIARIARPQMTVAGLAWFAIVTSAVTAGESEPPEPLLSQLVFRIQDPGPDSPTVKEFRYRFTIYSAVADDVMERDSVLCQTEDGLLRIPEPFPPYGRLHVWVEANDPERGYRHGFESFSYRINPEATTETPAIQLEQGIVLSGTVVDAETKKPIAGAEVAAGWRGRHESWIEGNLRRHCVYGKQLWFDWDRTTKTDQEGRFRLAVKDTEDVAARHPDYRCVDDMEDDETTADDTTAQPPAPLPTDIVLELQPLLTLRGRLVDTSGAPVLDDSWWETDPQGRFAIRLTRREWETHKEDKGELKVYGFRPKLVQLGDFSFTREAEFILQPQPEPCIEGQVLDEHGTPIEDCTIDIKCDDRDEHSFQFQTIPGSHQQGRWQYPVFESDHRFTIRMSLHGVVQSVRQYTREEATKGPIVTRFGDGCQLRGRLVAQAPLGAKNTPLIYLAGPGDKDMWQRATVQPDSTFVFVNLTDGKYTLHLFPPIDSLRNENSALVDCRAVCLRDFPSPIKHAEIPVLIEGKDVTSTIDLHAVGLRTGRIIGVAYHPDTGGCPFANLFGYICASQEHPLMSLGIDYVFQFMTDAEGRFQIDHCPPGSYFVRLSWRPECCSIHYPAVEIQVEPEKTLNLRLFAPDATNLAPAVQPTAPASGKTTPPPAL